MRKVMFFCLAGWVLLQAQAVQAQSHTLYTINYNENGPGATYGATALDGSGTYVPTTPLTYLSGGSLGNGLTYELPYTINTPGYVNSNQYEGIFLNDGSTKSHLAYFYNSSGNGYMILYSNDVGQGSSVSPATWATLVANDWDGYSVNKTPDGASAQFTSYGDLGGVPGDPAPHPAVEANYVGAFAVPEPTSLTLLGVFAGIAVGGLVWRRRKRV